MATYRKYYISTNRKLTKREQFEKNRYFLQKYAISKTQQKKLSIAQGQRTRLLKKQSAGINIEKELKKLDTVYRNITKNIVHSVRYKNAIKLGKVSEFGSYAIHTSKLDTSFFRTSVAQFVSSKNFENLHKMAYETNPLNTFARVISKKTGAHENNIIGLLGAIMDKGAAYKAEKWKEAIETDNRSLRSLLEINEVWESTWKEGGFYEQKITY